MGCVETVEIVETGEAGLLVCTHRWGTIDTGLKTLLLVVRPVLRDGSLLSECSPDCHHGGVDGPGGQRH